MPSRMEMKRIRPYVKSKLPLTDISKKVFGTHVKGSHIRKTMLGLEQARSELKVLVFTAWLLGADADVENEISNS